MNENNKKDATNKSEINATMAFTQSLCNIKNENMKTQTFITIFSLLCFLGCNQKNIKNNPIGANLNSKVKSVKEFTFKALDKSGEITKGDRWRNEVYEYDSYKMFNEKGNILMENIHESDGSLIPMYTYKYDDKDKLIERNQLGSNGNLFLQAIYKYDDKGKVIEEIIYNSFSDGSLRDKHTYKYDNKGNLIEEIYHDLDGGKNRTLYHKYINKYDDKDNVVEQNVYDFEGSLRNKYTFSYDDKGNIFVENRYDSNVNPVYKYTYKYDENGNIIEMVSYDYNNSQSNKFAYKYNYDKHGNWIKKIVFKNETPVFILEREFEYFK